MLLGIPEAIAMRFLVFEGCSSNAHDLQYVSPILAQYDHRQVDDQGHGPLEISQLGRRTACTFSQRGYIHRRDDHIFKFGSGTIGTNKLSHIGILEPLNTVLQLIVAGSVYIIF